MPQAITKEYRYTVIKNSDIDKYLGGADKQELIHILNRIERGRVRNGKEPKLHGVFIDDSWGRSDKAWDIIEEIINERSAY